MARHRGGHHGGAALLLPEWIPRAVGDQPLAPAPLTGTRGLQAALLALAVVAVAAGSWLVVRGSASDEVLTGDALVERVQALADEGRFADAFALVEAARDHGAVVPRALELRVTDRLTVLTDPPGARVQARRFVPDELEASRPERWEELGETPIRGLTVARGDYLLRLKRDGYVPMERLASSETERTGIPPDDVPETLIQARLLPAGEIPPDMVFVPGGPYSVASRNLQGLLANLQDFFIERFPVTNVDFARFVEAGGYLEPAHWERLRRGDGVSDPDAALRGFVDRTGLPGPRGWSGQRPPPGQDDHPVTGVIWYEAAAYCTFRGRRLPTLFEWEKTARDGEISYFATIRLPWGPLSPERAGRLRANFSGTGTTPVGAFPFGISPYGAYDMAGNAKEGLANATEAGRAVTGGSWEDPVYLFSEVGSLPPASTSPSLGFRCVQETDGAAAGTESPGSERLELAVETPEYEPVGDEAFAGLLSHYAYDRRPPEAEVVERLEAPSWTRERIRFLGPDDEWVIAYLYLPSTGRPPYQTLVFVPSASVFFGAEVPEVAEWLLAPVVRSGRVVFSVVMAGMTERPLAPGFQPPESHTARFRDLMVHHATELRMGLDYLETRDDVNMAALGYVGASWGAGSRLLFAAVDDRFDAVIFVGGGIDERVHPTLPEASNINFAPRIQAPTLRLNGRQDEEHPWLTRGLPLWNLLSEPKELVLVEDAGHVPPPHERVPAILDFLNRTLGPVPRRSGRRKSRWEPLGEPSPRTKLLGVPGRNSLPGGAHQGTREAAHHRPARRPIEKHGAAVTGARSGVGVAGGHHPHRSQATRDSRPDHHAPGCPTEALNPGLPDLFRGDQHELPMLVPDPDPLWRSGDQFSPEGPGGTEELHRCPIGPSIRRLGLKGRRPAAGERQHDERNEGETPGTAPPPLSPVHGPLS